MLHDKDGPQVIFFASAEVCVLLFFTTAVKLSAFEMTSRFARRRSRDTVSSKSLFSHTG